MWKDYSMDYKDEGSVGQEFLISQMQGVDDFIQPKDIKCPTINSSIASKIAPSMSNIITNRNHDRIL